MEIWKTIKNYPNYEISNLGNVKRKQVYQCKTERILIPLNNGNDYMNVGLSKNGIKKRKFPLPITTYIRRDVGGSGYDPVFYYSFHHIYSDYRL